MSLPIRVSGVPEGMEPQVDFALVTIEEPDGHRWTSRTSDAESASDGFWLSVAMPPDYFGRADARAVRARISLYMTLSVDGRAAAIPANGDGVYVPGVGSCRATQGEQLPVVCASAFRWPPSLVMIRSGEDTFTFPASVSYSPLPAEEGINPITAYAAILRGGRAAHPLSDSAVITIRDPTAHLRRDLEIQNLNLSEFVEGVRVESVP